MIRELLRSFLSDSGGTRKITARPTDSGLVFEPRQGFSPTSVDDCFEAAAQTSVEDQPLFTYLAQLCQEDMATISDGQVHIAWHDLYRLRRMPEHRELLALLGLPNTATARPILGSRNALSDSTFEIFVEGWIDRNKTLEDVTRVGAVLEVSKKSLLLSEEAWRLASEVEAFKSRPVEAVSQHKQEAAWGRIRRLANEALAVYGSRYLANTFVLTPETLQLPLTRESALGERVMVVAPTFEGAPEGWLPAFDSYRDVQPHYDLNTPNGRCRVLISEPVRRVLDVIKKQMPGRRVAGAKAEAFVRNPFAVLGPDAHQVINEAEFQQAKMASGLVPCVFTLQAKFEKGRVDAVWMLVTQHYADGSGRTDRLDFPDPNELQIFLDKLDQALRDERQCLPWEDLDLDLDGSSASQLEDGRHYLHLWRHQASGEIKFEDVYSLEQYGERIEGIGVAKPIYSAFIRKVSEQVEDPWAPENLVPLLGITIPGHADRVFIDLERGWIDAFDQQVTDAERQGLTQISNPRMPLPLPTAEARKLVESFRSILGAEEQLEQRGVAGVSKPLTKRKRETLLVKANIQQVDYVERRKAVLSVPPGAAFEAPKCLRDGILLKPHQIEGVRWLKHLVSLGQAECRGAVLADDMGLGKTLQIATAIAWHYEAFRDAPPSLIVAPVALLDNWRLEIAKFFDESFPKVLTLYGDALAEARQSNSYIDERLVEKGITNLLKPNWLGDAKVVLTTYETLRDYEFSFARQNFALMVCDEAQKIKTPSALVTLAAKKQKVSFKLACTGTPVENSLADIWCLFDYVQPGVLGALDEFGRTYRRPIEAKTEEQRNALDRLRALIAPQILRRTKADIADELPRKILVTNNEVERRLEVQLSDYQRQLYIEGLKKLRAAGTEKDARARVHLSFAVLHFIKAVCAEPFCLPGARFSLDRAGEERHLEKSPKIRWLIDQLARIRDAGEKVILFTELRQVQSALYQFLYSRFALKPFIINGDSNSRQALIDKFQQKDGFNAIILSPLAAGFGLNIVAANHVIHFTRTWNPAKENQATDRAYRIGQTRDVYVYCPTVVASDFVTFEAKLDRLMRHKSALATDMLDGAGPDFGLKDFEPEGPQGEGFESRAMSLEDVDRLDWACFEVFCKLLWEKRGYVSQVIAKVKGDGGIDVVAIAGKAGFLIQCKHSGSDANELGWDAIKEVVGGAALYQAMYPGVRLNRVAVSNRRFNAAAHEQAQHNHVDLVERSHLRDLLEKHPVMRLEFEDEVALRGILSVVA